MVKHGYGVRGKRHPIYVAWNNMLNRCRLPSHPSWHRYGGRGIKVCDRWLRFEDFLADMEPDWQMGLELERRNNDGNYEPGNCHWATRDQQMRNQKKNIVVNGMCLKDAARAAGLSYDRVRSRRRLGWPQEDWFK